MSDTKPKGRIYLVTDRKANTITPVRAINPSQAISFATRDQFEYRVATVDDAIGMDPKTILDATVPGVHPDQQKLDLPDASA